MIFLRVGKVQGKHSMSMMPSESPSSAQGAQPSFSMVKSTTSFSFSTTLLWKSFARISSMRSSRPSSML